MNSNRIIIKFFILTKLKHEICGTSYYNLKWYGNYALLISLKTNRSFFRYNVKDKVNKYEIKVSF